MKLGFFAITALAFSGVLVTACKGTVTTIEVIGDGGVATGDGGVATSDDDNPANQPPHSLGTITLGESHASGASKATPIVSASFLPAATDTPYCKTVLEGTCAIQKAAKCTQDTSTGTGCATGSYCTLDTSCASVCKVQPVCTDTCADDETCVAAGTSSQGTCQKTPSFDAGPIAFAGTTTSITLYPPYQYQGDGTGAPFLAGSNIQVQAAGAAGAGFSAFNETFSATTFIQTTTALGKIPSATVFGNGTVPVSWVPGSDTIEITVSGLGGAVTCNADDSAGTFAIPRSAITAALGDTTSAGTATLSMSIGRVKTDIKKDLTAQGTVGAETAQPVGWLYLTTISEESTSFEGCAGTATSCNGECVDLQSDSENCGACGNSCSGETCGSGSCGGTTSTTCQTCESQAETTTCASLISACTSDTSCSALLSCLQACTTTTCQTNCQSTDSAGVAKFNAADGCVANACTSQCN